MRTIFVLGNAFQAFTVSQNVAFSEINANDAFCLLWYLNVIRQQFVAKIPFWILQISAEKYRNLVDLFDYFNLHSRCYAF